MEQLREFITKQHKSVFRDFSLRNSPDKHINAEKAKTYGFDYWDGSRSTGYGGYINDGRWEVFAKKLIDTYQIQQADKVLDLGCGKGFLLQALKNKYPNLAVSGLDISTYAINCADPSIAKSLTVGEIENMNFEKNSFEYIFSLNTLHNLKIDKLFKALEKIESIKIKDSYIVVESYRTEAEKWNLMQWQLTCECFYTPEEWRWIFKKSGYTGDYEFIFFD